MPHFDLREILLMLPAILFGFSIHEFSHAIAATKLGDDTPAKQGRLTLNPIAHIDILGFILILLAGFGWAKPVQINQAAFKKPKRDDLLVSVAGPLSNLIFACFFAVVLKLLWVFARNIFYLEAYGENIYRMLSYFIWFNLILAVFNLLPILPLDGSHILFDLLPDKFHRFKERFFQFGSIILVAIILFENYSGMDILPIGKIAVVLYNTLFQLLGI